MRAWQRDHYHRKVLGGFREACDLENGFRRAQRGWTRKLRKVGTGQQAGAGGMGSWYHAGDRGVIWGVKGVVPIRGWGMAWCHAGAAVVGAGRGIVPCVGLGLAT